MVDVLSIAETDDEDHQTLVLDQAHDAIVPDTVSPKARERPVQRLTEPARIVAGSNSLSQKPQNSALDLPIESVELFAGVI